MPGPSLNLANHPPWVLASRHFNDDPRPVELQGVRQANRGLFERLDALAAPEERARVFHDWVSVRFQLHHWQAQATDGARRALRNSYVRFLRGWGVDASSIEGAVLKGWVESRFGITPTFHHARIAGVEDEAYQRYAADRTRGSARTSAILSQLDLVYEFTQYELARRFPGERWRTLWRGVHGEEEDAVLEREGRRDLVVRLNNLSSFTDDAERAWEFGYAVWQARVPLAKVFFFSGLLPDSLLRGEREWLVVGGEYRVTRLAG
ncbi:NAD(+)--dinitrogen-reductase ADP-D-ribosyltransferase [Anaeromyxobacter oryzae]|uniref:N-acyl homoserine lactonase n=1 Tax=Anaeromyxobacter oryzae TaxID=2918170 RepID=A0ABM7X275_9BACT|nr:NAD(+)--dinitrogen-reductase ADP-D-ribosyltransferase [Anaeromyxobacter oryzae]BDG05897.1 N-acyl homoserine lactonase [Anaeromyxobacter oryzae]